MDLNTIPLELDVQMFLRLLVVVVVGAHWATNASAPASQPGCGPTAWSAWAGRYSPWCRSTAGNIGDPDRVAAQIVTGIGFLGAGAIRHEQG